MSRVRRVRCAAAVLHTGACHSLRRTPLKWDDRGGEISSSSTRGNNCRSIWHWLASGPCSDLLVQVVTVTVTVTVTRAEASRKKVLTGRQVLAVLLLRRTGVPIQTSP